MSKSKKIDPVIARLHRVKGQLEAVEGMYKDKKCDCIKLLVQIQAARAAMGKVAEIVLADEAKRCVEEGEIEKLNKVVSRTFKTV